MEIRFLTKEESNKIREREFLELSPADRFFAFLELSRRINQLFPSKSSFEERAKGNFILERKEWVKFGRKQSSSLLIGWKEDGRALTLWSQLILPVKASPIIQSLQ